MNTKMNGYSIGWGLDLDSRHDRPDPKPKYTKTLRPEIVKKYGGRVARVISDAVNGQNITASISFMHVSTSELAGFNEAKITRGGFGKDGGRDGTPVICNV